MPRGCLRVDGRMVLRIRRKSPSRVCLKPLWNAFPRINGAMVAKIRNRR